jgi:hypothetical protein
MKGRNIVKLSLPIRLAVLVLCVCSLASAQEVKKSVLTPAEEAALKKAVKVVESWERDPVFIREIAAQNAQRMTLAQIQAIDKLWMAGGEGDRAARLQTNACAQHLKALVAAHPGFGESFAMDNQGANVCMTDRTSDFWQGDEAKWQKSFPGATFVDQPRYDTSAKAILVQVSVPIRDGGTVIGALTVGVNAKQLK